MKTAVVFLLLILLGSALSQQPSPSVAEVAQVAYPEGNRNWVHVKSSLIGPTHKGFSTMGGFQHIYANSEAMVGYRTRAFPEGSIIVFDWLEMKDNAGAIAEGSRRQVDSVEICFT